jgi:basic membrane protein A
VYTFGLGKDMSRYAPKSQLSAVVYNWGVHYIRSVRKVLEGTWKPINSWPGMADDAVRMAPYSAAVPPNVVSGAEEVRKAIVAGTLSPFDGPVTDNKGNLVIPSGKRLDGRDLQLERWFTAGVAG